MLMDMSAAFGGLSGCVCGRLCECVTCVTLLYTVTSRVTPLYQSINQSIKIPKEAHDMSTRI